MKTVCLTALPHGICGAIIGSLFHGAPSRTGWRPREKKAERTISSDYLDEVLADFSGYIAADEAYDSPFCILFIVDNHSFKRLCYEVLDHDPDHKDIEQFFRRFQKHLDARGFLRAKIVESLDTIEGDWEKITIDTERTVVIAFKDGSRKTLKSP